MNTVIVVKETPHHPQHNSIQTAVFGGGANTSALMGHYQEHMIYKSRRKGKEGATTTQKIKL